MTQHSQCCQSGNDAKSKLTSDLSDHSSPIDRMGCCGEPPLWPGLVSVVRSETVLQSRGAPGLGMHLVRLLWTFVLDGNQNS